MTARFQVRRDGIEAAVAAVREFVAYVAANEPGTFRYESLQEKDDPTRFLHVFVFRDAEARRIHSSSPGVERFTNVLYPLCVPSDGGAPVSDAGVRFTEFALIATTESQP